MKTRLESGHNSLHGLSQPSEDTERIRDASDIVRIIGARISLKKAGPRYEALCPFHRESSPSFKVDPIRRRFHCFGCGAHGDVFDFVQKLEGVSFADARRGLAELAGIVVADRPQSPEDRALWAAEQRAFERELPTARLWLCAAIMQGDELLTLLKGAISDRAEQLMALPDVDIVPLCGEIADWERRLHRWRHLDSAELLAEYQVWRTRDPKSTGAMVNFARSVEAADVGVIVETVLQLEGSGSI